MSLTLREGEPGHGARPVIVLDGTESIEGRALLTLSALYFCADWLHRVEVRLSDVTDESVVYAAEALRWDCGVSVSVLQGAVIRTPLAGADLYAGIAFRSARHLRLSEAAAAGIPALVAIQFPAAEEFHPGLLLRQRTAFDPREFARELSMVVKPWL